MTVTAKGSAAAGVDAPPPEKENDGCTLAVVAFGVTVNVTALPEVPWEMTEELVQLSNWPEGAPQDQPVPAADTGVSAEGNVVETVKVPAVSAVAAATDGVTR